MTIYLLKFIAVLLLFAGTFTMHVSFDNLSKDRKHVQDTMFISLIFYVIAGILISIE